MKFQGRLSDWKDDKGFGFVEPNGGGERSFVHISEFINASRRPVVGDLIIYQQQIGKKGSEATQIQLASDRKKTKSSNDKHRNNKSGQGSSTLGRFVTPIFVGFLLFSAWSDRLDIEVVLAYGLMSIIAFIAYAWDKSAAEANNWRTQESTLHIIGLLGGWPGGFYAQRWLRHKSSKKQFLRIFWLSVIGNWGILLWFFTEKGAKLVSQVSQLLSNLLIS